MLESKHLKIIVPVYQAWIFRERSLPDEEITLDEDKLFPRMSLKTRNCVSIDGDVINALLFIAKVEARTCGQLTTTDETLLGYISQHNHLK